MSRFTFFVFNVLFTVKITNVFNGLIFMLYA